VTNVSLNFEPFCPPLEKALIRAKTKYFEKIQQGKKQNKEVYAVEKIEKFYLKNIKKK
jgi:hypothetical protein